MAKVHSLDQCSFSIAQGSRFCASSFVQWTLMQKGFWISPMPWMIAFWNSQGTSNGHVPSILWAFLWPFCNYPVNLPVSELQFMTTAPCWCCDFFSSCYTLVTVPNLTYKFYISSIVDACYLKSGSCLYCCCCYFVHPCERFLYLICERFLCNMNISRSTWLIFGEK